MNPKLFCLFIFVFILAVIFLMLSFTGSDPRDFGYGRCKHCNRSWRVVSGHDIKFCDPKDSMKVNGKKLVCDPSDRNTWYVSMFPICNKCFNKLSKKQIKVYMIGHLQNSKSYGIEMDFDTAIETAFQSLDLEK